MAHKAFIISNNLRDVSLTPLFVCKDKDNEVKDKAKNKGREKNENKEGKYVQVQIDGCLLKLNDDFSGRIVD